MAIKRRAGKQQRARGPAAAEKKSRRDVGTLFGQAAAADEEIWSDEDDDRKQAPADEASSEDEDRETAQEKKVRLAKQYLRQLEQEEQERDDSDSDEDGDGISKRLYTERLKATGRHYRSIAPTLADHEFTEADVTSYGGPKLSITCVALSGDDTKAMVGCKDNSVLQYDVETGARTVLKPRWRRETAEGKQEHHGEILAVAVTSDGRYTAAGGRDRLIHIIDNRIGSEVEAFTGHKDAVTGLTFRKDSYMLLSASLDRSVKHWDLNEMGYLETLFGHQSDIHDIDMMAKERAVTCSGDRTVRLWQIAEDNHLKYNGHGGSIDCVRMFTEEQYVSGGQDGNICLWQMTRKKPVCKFDNAHGVISSGARWITSLGTARMTDLVASGSHDGFVRLWQANYDHHQIAPVAAIPVPGFVNALSVASSNKFIIAGTGQEHKFGRWWREKAGRNRLYVIRLPPVGDA